MNIIFAVEKNSYNSEDHLGVQKKVTSQINQMEKMGYQVELQQYEWVNRQLNLCVYKETDVLYFRRIISSIKLIKSLRNCKRINKNITIIMEIPTYPYKKERRRLTLKEWLNEVIGDILLRKYVDRIALCAPERPIPYIHGIKTIPFVNGVDFDSFSLNKGAVKGDDINIICVSGCMYAHGYDRLIEGLNIYYSGVEKKRNVYFHLVGTGEYYGEYINLADKYGLTDKVVFFYGAKNGTELDKIYSKCNLAVAHLATYRIGIHNSSSLKSREYAARGVPFIIAPKLDVDNEDTSPYIHYVPDNNTPIDIWKVIEFFDNVYSNEEVPKKMKIVFEKYCDWEYSFKNILSYMKEIENDCTCSR